MNSIDNYIIVGGGLSGLCLAYQLSKIDINATIIEGSSRLGGRILTTKGKRDTPLELGATWFSDMHSNVLQLIDELGLSKYPQYSKGISLFETNSFEPPQKFNIPESQDPSWRIKGGTQTLTDELAGKLSDNKIHLNSKIISIKASNSYLELESANGKVYKGKKVILCIPPELISRIKFTPELPFEVNDILPKVQTWMAGAVKFVLEYDEPFWRDNGYSGMLFSHVGIVSEMHDHTNLEETKYGFTGFLNGGSARYSKEIRRNYVLQHLSKLLGDKANYSTFYDDKIWTDEFIVHDSNSMLRAHQNNGHPLLQKTYMNERLFFCNTETATEFSGYMEGAIRSSISLFEKLK
ncbi:flavin monoamine oxidase family protein [Winogradskyella aquimaris]|uniref:NAD(P)/FAD-dependent oxidoreductase n=1 Tax=Winogradskyella aquimaris TaxID=864074 RepID=A0ABU5EQ71_9FLAO|nr:NAD(P)/FAD-dependent oxidoreductase [Winogradskyella aquimaris]MDY2587865.1 NAD(P)/FAD-dependent oxidoreductase [Winogradskyella aquimaris]